MMQESQMEARSKLKLILSPDVSADRLTDMEKEVASSIEDERNLIRNFSHTEMPRDINELKDRIETLRGLQAILRALLRRFKDQISGYESSTSSSTSSSAAAGSRRGSAAGAYKRLGQNFEALLAETEAMVGGYLALAAIRSLEQSMGRGFEINRHHVCAELEVPYTAMEGGRDFELVKEDVLSEVWGITERPTRPLARAPLKAFLGAWWTVGGEEHHLHQPSQGVLALGASVWIPWQVLVHRLRTGGGSGSRSVSDMAQEAQRLRLLSLYAVIDAVAASQPDGVIDIGDLRDHVAGPFSAHVSLTKAESLTCLAYWSADDRGRRGTDKILLTFRGGGGGGLLDGKQYRQLLWTLAYHGKYEEATHLLDVSPPPSFTPLDGCLLLGVLLGQGQWEQAFVRQRVMASGPLSTLPPRHRFAPLKLLVHRLVECRRINWLTSLPLSPAEEQHIVSTLYQSTLPTRDHALLALLLRRRQFARAWAMYTLVEPDILEDTASARMAKENLCRLIGSIERFIPQEELEAMRKARDGGDRLLLEMFANFASLPGDDDGGEVEGKGGVLEWMEGGRVPLKRPTHKAPMIPGGGGRDSFDGAGGSTIYHNTSLAHFDPSPLKRGGGDRRRSSEDMMDYDATLSSPPAASLYYYDPVPGAPTPVSERRNRGGGSGSSAATAREAGASRIRSPPVALRPGWSSRRDSFGSSNGMMINSDSNSGSGKYREGGRRGAAATDEHYRQREEDLMSRSAFEVRRRRSGAAETRATKARSRRQAPFALHQPMPNFPSTTRMVGHPHPPNLDISMMSTSPRSSRSSSTTSFSSSSPVRHTSSISKPLSRSSSNPSLHLASSPSHKRHQAAKPPLRKGKWTPEEEIYAHYIIDNFNKGLINLSRGTTLRSYLSDRLNCDPMRVTKKFSGTSCIGKSVFCPCEPSPENLDMMKAVSRRLDELEANFKTKVESNAHSAIHVDGILRSMGHHWLTAPIKPPTPTTAPSSSATTPTNSSYSTHPDYSTLTTPKREHHHILPSRHSSPDLASVIASSTAGGSTGMEIEDPFMPSRSNYYPAAAASGRRPLYPTPARRSMSSSRLDYHQHNSHQQHHYTGGNGMTKRSRTYEADDFSLDDHDAGDLLVNFFASVHRNYATVVDDASSDRESAMSTSSSSTPPSPTSSAVLASHVAPLPPPGLVPRVQGSNIPSSAQASSASSEDDEEEEEEMMTQRREAVAAAAAEEQRRGEECWASFQKHDMMVGGEKGDIVTSTLKRQKVIDGC